MADGFAEVEKVDMKGTRFAFGDHRAKLRMSFFARALLVDDADPLKVDVGVDTWLLMGRIDLN